MALFSVHYLYKPPTAPLDVNVSQHNPVEYSGRVFRVANYAEANVESL